MCIWMHALEGNKMTETLYKDRRFKSWTVNNLAETLCEEWADLYPTLIKDRKSFGRKVTSVAFHGEVNITLNIMKQRYPKDGILQVVFELSLSPKMDDLTTYVLNGFDFSHFVSLSSKLSGSNFFTIGKTETWEGSVFQQTAQVGRSIIETMLTFESCFNLLIQDESKVRGEIFDMRKTNQQLMHVKAYSFANVYGHREKLDDAVVAIKRSLVKDDYARSKVEKFCLAKSADGEDWLYTNELLERICN